MSTIKDRIIEFIRHEKISKRGFSASINRSSSYVNNIVSTISAEVIQEIRSAYPNLNIDWLLTGEGKMKKDDTHLEQNTEAPKINGSLELLAKAIETLSESEKTNTQNIQELIAQGREQTSNITKLVDLLCKSGIIPDNISIDEKREPFSESDTDKDTAYNADNANVG